ncbi:Telomere zinc finger-associated protein [Paramyrothecium foliicola]|nr:Telomere zinc finger-associated protein [Paramyrothecium foliicola]
MHYLLKPAYEADKSGIDIHLLFHGERVPDSLGKPTFPKRDLTRKQHSTTLGSGNNFHFRIIPQACLQLSLKMYDCQWCDATFWSESDCEDHMDDEDHWPECETCPKTFRTQRACEQHMDDKQHWAPRFDCETCTRDFSTRHGAEQHMNALRHWKPKIECETCTAMFFTQTAADQHMKAKAHFRHYCQSCDQRFSNDNNLKMHLNSKVHRGTTVPCPFCKTCYTTASGVVNHIETGSCPNAPQLNRATILRMIRERDTRGLITNKTIAWQDEENVKYTATGRAYNGQYWECYLCHSEYYNMAGLNAHLNSAAHVGKVYRCPNKASCGKQFSTLAGLFAHLESESCAFMRFEKVQQQLGLTLQGRNLVKFS